MSLSPVHSGKKIHSDHDQSRSKIPMDFASVNRSQNLDGTSGQQIRTSGGQDSSSNKTPGELERNSNKTGYGIKGSFHDSLSLPSRPSPSRPSRPSSRPSSASSFRDRSTSPRPRTYNSPRSREHIQTTASPTSPATPSQSIIKQKSREGESRPQSRPQSRRSTPEILQNTWIFSPQELHYTPSYRDGIKNDQEISMRAKGINFIIHVGMYLRLPQMTIYAAAVFFHRFYMRSSLKRFHYYDMGATSLFLATKVEETNRRLRDIVIACTKIASKNTKLVVDEQSKDFWRWRDTILYDEETLLELLCFDMSLDSPYEILSNLVQFLDVSSNKPLCQNAWAFVNDSCRTTICLLYPIDVIAVSALYWASLFTSSSIDSPEWWLKYHVDLEQIRQLCKLLADKFGTLPELEKFKTIPELFRRNDTEINE